MRQILGRFGFARIGVAALTFAVIASTNAIAQDSESGAASSPAAESGAAETSAPASSNASAPAGKNQAQIQDAAKKAYQAIADSKIDDLWVLVESKYDRKLRPEKLRPLESGPKVSVAFDGNVKVLRQGKNDAVVGANFFKPDSNDTPASEVSRLSLYMVNDHGSWKIGAPDKKEAGFDGDRGGWYHSGSFTFCPNKGMVFLPNHFSSQTTCASTAICR
jgi:hypothetical protein